MVTMPTKKPKIEAKCYAKGCEADARYLVEFNDFGKTTWVAYCMEDGMKPAKANHQRIRRMRELTWEKR